MRRWRLLWNINYEEMRKVCVLLICFFTLLQVSAADYQVVPLPQSIQHQEGAPFMIDETVRIAAGADLQREAVFLRDYVEELLSRKLDIVSKPRKGERHIFLVVSSKVKHPEGYTLFVNKDKITIEGGSGAGVFYGIQTLRKSLVANNALSPVIIHDAPRFSWRGMHLDCSRHFFPVSFVKKYIDLLALHQMNVFHWHLTDDQGWRIEIKKWQKLITVGSHRTGTIIGTNSDIDDETPYGGYYTQDEAREIVAYAKERHITVVPEIDMPGHMLAALASYPELGCTGGPYQVGHYWGVYKDVLCVGNEKVYQFVEDVLTEIMDIFPSEVIHIGGDEKPTDRWNACPRCQQLSAKLAATPEMTLQGFFTRRVFDFITSHQRRALGWDELLENNAPQNTMIMSWRGTKPGAKAAAMGHDVVMAPTSHCYFDYQQGKAPEHEPSRCSGFIPVKKVYSLEPVPDSLTTDARNPILGVQANLWAEYLTTPGLVEYQALPRAAALAEVQWTQPERKGFEGFCQRLTRLARLYDWLGYQYAKHLWPERQLPSRWRF